MQPVPQSPQTNRQGGYTIVELSIALTIISILIVSGLVAVNSVLTSSKANSQIEDSGRGLAKLQSFVTVGTSGITTSGAIGMGLFPSSRVSGTTITNQFGGREFVEANLATLDGVDASKGAIYSLTSIPKQICTDIAASLAPLAYSVWVSTTISGTTTTTFNTPPTTALDKVKTAGSAVDAAAIGRQCNGADTVGMSFLIKP